MARPKDAAVSLEPVVELARDSAQTGQKTAKLARDILCETRTGFVIPTAKERETILVAFVRAGYVIYGNAFDIVRCTRPVDLRSSDASVITEKRPLVIT